MTYVPSSLSIPQLFLNTNIQKNTLNSLMNGTYLAWKMRSNLETEEEPSPTTSSVVLEEEMPDKF